MNISDYIDYTSLQQNTTERDIINLCHEAKENMYHAICVNSCYVALAKELLESTKVKVCTVVGFPLGATSTTSKVFEAQKAVEDGADEIDMVINLGFFKSKNYVAVLKDIYDVKLAIGVTPLKVAIEISELNKNEIIKACQICLDGKADFIKTSSGFSKNGATLTAVKIIKKTVKDGTKIKAAGHIEDYETALKYIEAGADRIETSVNIKTSVLTQLNKNIEIYKNYIDNLESNKISDGNSIIKNSN